MFELEVVINTDFGGFSLNSEMVLWLLENRNWTILKQDEYDYNKKDYPITTLIDMQCGDFFYSTCSNSIEFRSNKDLIDCVYAIKELHKNDNYKQRHNNNIHNLSVNKIKIHIGIEDYHDGKERISCNIEQDYDD